LPQPPRSLHTCATTLGPLPSGAAASPRTYSIPMIDTVDGGTDTSQREFIARAKAEPHPYYWPYARAASRAPRA
jgi:hypothetical protein